MQRSSCRLAASTSTVPSISAPDPVAPKDIVPRPISDTRSPDLPSGRYSMSRVLDSPLLGRYRPRTAFRPPVPPVDSDPRAHARVATPIRDAVVSHRQPVDVVE